MKKLILKISQIVFIFSCSINGADAKNVLNLSCNILEPNSFIPKKEFTPGESILVSLQVEGTNNGKQMKANIERKVDINVSSSVKIARFC